MKIELFLTGIQEICLKLKNLNELLSKYSQKIDIVIKLQVSLEIIKKRITGRLTCSKCSKTFNEFFSPPPTTI